MRVLSGIQPTGRFHWGNYFGAIRQYIALQENEQAFYFIADLHALTTIRDAGQLRSLTRDAALDLLALGLDPEQATLFRQSDVPEVTELTWLLLTVTNLSWLEKCHAYKDKKERGVAADAGLFTYPVLMASDILIYDSDIVPVGVDQVQHIEVTRDIAERFNSIYGEVFVLPESRVLDDSAKVPGTDGEKMSKSLGNFFTIREVLEKYHPEVVRYLLVSSHYRSAINYSEDNLKEAKGALERFYNALKGLPEAAPAGGDAFAERFAAAMDDDFNTPEACAVLFEMVREVNRLKESDVAAAAGLAARLRQLAEVLGVLQLDADAFLQAGAAGKVDAAEVEALIAARLQARADKNWGESDRIRDQLTAMGIVLEDGKGGTTWRLAE